MQYDENSIRAKLSPAQQKVVFHDAKKFVVRASPWSGKTYSISARIAYQMGKWEHRNRWMAILSFTNAWKDELEKKCKEEFNTYVSHPHFLGTIDSFINHYIFLPFWHLVLWCKMRPKLIWEPHEKWYKSSDNRLHPDYDDSVAYVSFDKDDILIPIYNNSTIHLEKLFYFRGYNPKDKTFSDSADIPMTWIKKDWNSSKHMDELLKKKWTFLKDWYANQSDANYFALKILKKYPDIAKELAHKFPVFIIDEAQDTSEIHMEILDILESSWIEEMVYIGDPDQSIYEWNNAKPELFLLKYTQWKDSLILNENYRSTKTICDFTHRISTLESPSVSMVSLENEITPEFIIYDSSTPEWIGTTIINFLDKCSDIPKNEIYITARWKNFFSPTSDIHIPAIDKKIFLKWKNYLGRDILSAKAHYEDWKLHLSLEKLMRFFFKLELGDITYDNDKLLEWKYNKESSGHVRHIATGFLEWLDSVNNQNSTLAQWLKNCNTLMGSFWIDYKFLYEESMSKISISSFVADNIKGLTQKINTQEHIQTTIHWVKGKSCDAMLLFLKKKCAGNKNYSTILGQWITDTGFWDEEIRNIYVAITRPRKILTIAVPSIEEKEMWESIFWISTHQVSLNK